MKKGLSLLIDISSLDSPCASAIFTEEKSANHIYDNRNLKIEIVGKA